MAKIKYATEYPAMLKEKAKQARAEVGQNQKNGVLWSKLKLATNLERMSV